MDYTEEYLSLISDAQTEIRELNTLLATGNSLMQMWAGMNMQISEQYRKIADKTKELEKLCNMDE